MSLTLITNPGSSSRKYALYEGDVPRLTVTFERTETGIVRCLEVNKEQPHCSEEAASQDNLSDSLPAMLQIARAQGILTDQSAITAVGLRVVAPGAQFARHQVITENFATELAAATSQAPLHVPAVVAELQELRSHLPNATYIAVSDSAFHQSIPKEWRTYSPAAAREHGIERFGYHGLSVASVAAALPGALGSTPARTVVTHVGSGVSVTALQDGVSVFTTMGYTPASGVMMSSRAADLDPGAVAELLAREKLSGAAAHQYLQTRGGFAGLVGETDLRAILHRGATGDQAAKDAYQHFVRDLQHAIAAATVSLGGVDALIFTATAAERNDTIRADVVAGLDCLGLQLDPERNRALHSRAGIVSAADSSAIIAIIPTNELGMMAKICQELLEQN
jgi:acetate kinase